MVNKDVWASVPACMVGAVYYSNPFFPAKRSNRRNGSGAPGYCGESHRD